MRIRFNGARGPPPPSLKGPYAVPFPHCRRTRADSRHVLTFPGPVELMARLSFSWDSSFID